MKMKIMLLMTVFCANQLQAMDRPQTDTEIPRDMICARIADASSTIGDFFYLTKDDPRQAQTFYEVTDLLSESSTPKKYNLCQLAKIAVDEKKFTAAKELLDEAGKITGDKAYADAQFCVATGYFEEESGNKKTAAVNYRNALLLISNSEQTPLSTILHYKLGLIAEDDGKTGEAINQYLQAFQGLRSRGPIPANICAFQKLCQLLGIQLNIASKFPETSITALEKLRMEDLNLEDSSSN